MKKFARLLLVLTALVAVPLFAQQPAAPVPLEAPKAPHLSKFNLDFAGGTPAELAETIRHALGRPLNVVVADELANWKLPPLKMSNVDVLQVFRALEQASQLQGVVVGANGGYQLTNTMYGFRTGENGPPNDDTVWAFYVSGSGAAHVPKVSRFYFLKPYLDGGLTVEDITTAIEAAWKMRGDATPPALRFHKETNLLIAVGDYAGLDVIDQVLKALDGIRRMPARRPVVAPEEEAKTKP